MDKLCFALIIFMTCTCTQQAFVHMHTIHLLKDYTLLSCLKKRTVALTNQYCNCIIVKFSNSGQAFYLPQLQRQPLTATGLYSKHTSVSELSLLYEIICENMHYSEVITLATAVQEIPQICFYLYLFRLAGNI